MDSRRVPAALVLLPAALSTRAPGAQTQGLTKRPNVLFIVADDLRNSLGAYDDDAWIEYLHVPKLAPTRAVLDAFKKRGGSWQSYEQDFVELLSSRHVEEVIPPSVLNQSCLLCSEKRPDHCHRRLVAEYFQKQWTDVEIEHLF